MSDMSAGSHETRGGIAFCRCALLFTVASGLGLAAMPGLRAQQVSLGGGPVEHAVLGLRPGEFLWAPEIAPSGPVLAIVSLEAQRAYIYRNGVLIGVSTASTGRPGHETPAGIFTILQKEVDHKSNLYDDAPMPFMQRLTWTGVAMHAGDLPGYPASHGCIRLPLAFARKLYGVSRLGMTVVITNHAAVPRVAPTPGVLEDLPNTPEQGDEATTWQPERAATGPISIVVSGADHRMVVLRNGVVIGSTPVSMVEPVTMPEAFSLRSAEGGVFHWMQVPLSDEAVTDGSAATVDASRLSIPESFRRRLAAILTPGATVVVTPDTLEQGATGRALTVIAGQDGG